MKRFFLSLICALLCSLGVMAEAVTFTSFNSQSLNGSKDGVSYTSSIGTNSNGTGPNMGGTNSNQLRMYEGNTMTISTNSGILKKITFTTGSGATYGGALFAYNGNAIAQTNASSVAWDCSSLNLNSLTLSATGSMRLSGITVEIGSNVAKESYTVTILEATNGSITIKDGSTTISSGDMVEEGRTLTIEVSPATGYRFKNWGYKDGDAAWVGNNTTSFTHVMPSAPCSFKATFEVIPTYAIKWSVNGSIVKSENLQEGATVTAPTVSSINDKVFYGWAETASVDATNPSMVTPSATATKNVTYYAVFANVEAGSTQTVTDVMTQTWTTSTKTTYAAWTNKTLLSSAKYSGKTAGGNSSIQLRNNSTNQNPTYEGIITTTSGGKAKKVTVEWESNTAAGRTLNVYGKNTAYSAVKDIFDNSKCGTLLGSIAMGTSTELTITGDYEYLALGSASGAMYLTSISIEWEIGTPDTYSNFTTNVPVVAGAPYTVKTNSEGWASFCANVDVTLPDGLVAYIGSFDTENNAVVLTQTAITVIPEKTGIILKGTASTSYTLETAEVENTVDLSANDLNGTVARTARPADATIYALTIDDNNTTVFMRYTGAYIPANKAYLPISIEESQAPAMMRIVEATDEVTDVENVEIVKAVKFIENGVLYIQKNGCVYNAMGQLVK